MTPYDDKKFNVDNFLSSQSIDVLRAQLAECESNREKWRDACETQGFKLAEVEECLDRLVEEIRDLDNLIREARRE